MAAVGLVQALVELFRADEATLRRKKTDRDQRPVFPSATSKFAPLILAYRGSALPWLVEITLFSAPAESGVYSPDRALPGFLRKCPLPLAYHHVPKGTKLELGRGGPGNTILDPPSRRCVSTDQVLRRANVQRSDQARLITSVV